jgi:lipid-binding SYLF domain-containing protein
MDRKKIGCRRRPVPWIRHIAAVVLMVLLHVTGAAGPALGAPTQEELDKLVTSADTVVRRILDMPDRGIPRDLLRRCKGIAVFPGMFKAGAVVGFSYGNGVILRRIHETSSWSKPAFFKIRGGSLGLQLGAQSIDLILLIMSESGLHGLLEERFTLGADVAVSAGPVGRKASAETDVAFLSEILSYSRSKGLFAGISLSGASVEPDADANRVYHGANVSVQDVFYDDAGNMTEASRKMIETLQERFPKKTGE